MNGKRELEVEFKDGKMCGQGFVWWPNGILKEMQLYCNDSFEGASFSWFETGELNSVLHFKKDELDGKAVFWNMDGTPRMEATFSNGEVVPPIRIWTPDGKLSILSDPDSSEFADAALLLPRLQRALGTEESPDPDRVK